MEIPPGYDEAITIQEAPTGSQSVAAAGFVILRHRCIIRVLCSIKNTHIPLGSCGLLGCKNRHDPFPGSQHSLCQFQGLGPALQLGADTVVVRDQVRGHHLY